MKEKVTVTAKVQVVVSAEQRESLLRTGEAYRDASNRISQHVFDTGEENFYNLNRTLYIIWPRKPRGLQPLRMNRPVVSNG